jgi:hypothetical protein
VGNGEGMLGTYDCSYLLQDVQQNEHATNNLTNCKTKYMQGIESRTNLRKNVTKPT